MSDFVSSLPVLPQSNTAAQTSVVDAAGNLNVGLLKSEIATNLREDATYKAVDAMKKKAIHTAGTYEEFKNFVACAEQKPLGRGEMESLKETKGSWRQQLTRHEMNKKKSKNLSKKEKKRTLKTEFPTEPPATSMIFDREWRRHCKDYASKWRLLSLCGPAHAGSLWTTEIDANIMGAIIETLDFMTNPPQEGKLDAGGVLEWLRMLTGCGRFDLNVNFLNPEQVKKVGTLLDGAGGGDNEGVVDAAE
eukprot:CAMPEP_0182455242 /NCGR_PEP_ID=MMETSP1319-20130603/1498_1 /TAXON_ID=172717 /ORGANISM="Bolidomonas pacifica, Strain RCC208" /LENGTH=247 /DNA_ID=CAMNT_0024653285 /DNA_START=205 /DNA_END=945 /DNA_ORIENTATION=+